MSVLALPAAQKYRPLCKSRRCLLGPACLVLLSIVWGPGLPAVAAADPLQMPAIGSARLAESRLMAAAAAGDRLVAVGPYGRIALSDDRGETWQQARVPLSSDLVAVDFPSAERGWAVGHDGVILHSADGGRTWEKQLDGFQVARLIRDYYAAHPALEGTDVAALTEEVERFQSEGADKPFLDVRFLDEHEGFAVGAFNLALRTRDGGRTWQPLNDRTANPGGLHLYGLGIHKGELYMVGEAGLLRRWDRRQERFVVLQSPYQGSFFGVQGNAEGVLAYGMRGNAFLSRDGGQSWTRLETPTSAGLNGGIVLADGRQLLVSEEGELLLLKEDRLSLLATRARMPLYGIAQAGQQAVALVGRRGVSVEALH